MTTHLTHQDIRGIYKMLYDPKATYGQVAGLYDVSITTAYHIAIGARYAHVTGGAIPGRIKNRSHCKPRISKQFTITPEIDGLIDDFREKKGICRGAFLEFLVLDYQQRLKRRKK